MNDRFKLSSIKNTLRACLSLAITATFTVSCSVDKDMNESAGNLQINLKGIEEYVDADKIGKLASRTGSQNNGPVEIQSHDGFDAIANVNVIEPIADNSNDKIASIAAPKNINKVATNVPLKDTVKYALAFYTFTVSGEDTTFSLVDGYPKEITGSSQPTMQLPFGAYKWIAYSFNSSQLPTFNNDLLKAEDIVNKDFMYANGKITITGGYNYLDLVFKRKTAKFDVKIDTRGMFGKINDATKVQLFLTRLNGQEGILDNRLKENFDLVKNSFVGNDIILNAVPSPWREVDASTGRYEMISSFYIIGYNNHVVTSNPLRVMLSPLNLTMDDGTVRNITGQHVNFRTGPFTVKDRSVITLDAMLVESAIRVVNGGAQWARTNLWYDPSPNQLDRYRLRVTPRFRDVESFIVRDELQGLNLLGLISLGVKANAGYNKYYTDQNDLWAYGSSKPVREGAEITSDPCLSIYPRNLWMMPYSAHYSSLKTSTATNSADLKEVKALHVTQGATPLYDYSSAFSTTLVGYDLLRLFESARLSVAFKWNRLNEAPIPPSVYDEFDMNDLYLMGVGYRAPNRSVSEFEAISRPSITKLLTVIPYVTPALASDGLLSLGLAEGFSGGGFYWTRDNLGNLTSNNGSYFNFNVSNTSLVDLSALGINVNLLSTSNPTVALKSDVSKDAGMNIRCIRNANYPNPPAAGTIGGGL